MNYFWHFLFWFGYAFIGNTLTSLSLNVWKKKKSRGILSFLLFPLSSANDDVAPPITWFVGSLKGEIYYRFLLNLFWPFKVLCSLFFFLVFLLMMPVAGIQFCIKLTDRQMDKFCAYLVKRKERRTKQDEKLDEADLQLEGMEDLKRLRSEFDRLNQEKNKVYQQLEEVERNLEASRRHPFRTA